MMHFLYNILAVCLAVAAIPLFTWRLMQEKGFGERLRQSFGFIPAEIMAPVAEKNCIWIHAASVGEIVAASPIVKEIRKTLPGNPILISVVTANGYEMARRIISDADSIIYFPLDLPWLSDWTVRRIRPRVFLPVETELWPNFLRSVRRQGIPVMMVNGRISEKSVARYRYLRGILANMLETIIKFCMQSTIDAQYIIQMGADPKRVIVTGNTKFDQTYTDTSPEKIVSLRRQLGLTSAEPIIVAGSTHKGEEELLLAAFTKVKAVYSQAALIIAPREILRAEELLAMAAEAGFEAKTRTALTAEPAEGHELVILNTIGELGQIYSLGDIIFVGGSLVSLGGHNILEPAAHGKPIVVGPHMFNFKESYALFSGRNACATVFDEASLAEKWLEILANETLRRTMSEEALTIIRENRGAAHKSAVCLKELLENRQ
ncbi:MAG: Three-deoxy-D-manno-octulosonic-acid transferase protein [Firmicutes bacterium]|nr:Three-deoxy-D-manno-octulosonic-acid transferase protein [Bacillota bacterium]